MTDLQRQVDRRSAAELLEGAPDWAMLAIVAILVAGWLSWIAVAAYRLFVSV
jgi:hypothetical protein